MKRFILSLNGKISIVMLFIVLPSFLVLYLNSLNIKKNWQSQQITKTENEIILYTSAIEDSIQLLEESLLYLPLNNDHFQQLSLSSSKLRSDTQEYWTSVLKIKDQLNSIQDIYSYVENIFFYYPEQNLFLNYEVNPEMTAIIQQLPENSFEKDTGLWHISETSKGAYLYWVTSYNSCEIGLWISCDTLIDFFVPRQTNPEKKITDPEHPDEILLLDTLGNVLTPSGYKEKIPVSSENIIFSEKDEILIYNYISHPGIYLLKKIVTETDIPTKWYDTYFITICLLSFILIISVVISISYWVLRPVHSLVRGIDRISSGDISYRFPESDKNSMEFRQIETRFNQMIDQLEQMRIQIYENELEQKETKLRYLSQQIQPHFILNSLNTLYTYSSRDVSETRKIILLLSQYYRYVVNIESRYVQLDQELEHIENYLAIQKIRYPRFLNYHIHCEEGVKIVPIPPFLLESFVGNSLKHGKNEQEQIFISLDAVQVKPFLIRITISDQGEGFPSEILDAISIYQKEGTKDPCMGIGIYNSIERLKLIYQNHAVIHCYNANGAVVEIQINLNHIMGK